MFTLSTCTHCKAAKKFMEKYGIDYECCDVDLFTGDEQSEIIEEVRKFNPLCTFPTIIIGNKVVVGFREELIREILGL